MNEIQLRKVKGQIVNVADSQAKVIFFSDSIVVVAYQGKGTIFDINAIGRATLHGRKVTVSKREKLSKRDQEWLRELMDSKMMDEPVATVFFHGRESRHIVGTYSVEGEQLHSAQTSRLPSIRLTRRDIYKLQSLL